jgi:hypothetical protein
MLSQRTSKRELVNHTQPESPPDIPTATKTFRRRKLIPAIISICGLTGPLIGALPAEAAPQGSGCRDGGGIWWQTRVDWGAPYTDASGVRRVSITAAAWTTNRRSTATDSRVRTFNPNGTLVQTLTRTATVDYRRSARWDQRNPLDPRSGPGATKVEIKVGRDADGFGDCTVTYRQPSSNDPVIAAVGDSVCAPTSPVTPTTCQHGAVSSSILAARPAAYLALGDLQDPHGELANFNTAYERSYGRFKGITRPVPGNHEYEIAGATGYFTYFGPILAPQYYSYNVGSWHMVALNSEIDHSAGSPQVQWLKNDLANNTRRCVIAYWHRPRFAGGVYGRQGDQFQPFWEALVKGGVDLVITAHTHNYQYFGPRNAAGNPDPNGVPSVIVGTGGRSYGSDFEADDPYKPLKHMAGFGWERITLHRDSADLSFRGVGNTLSDDRRVACR